MFVGPLCEMKWESEASRLVEPGIEVLPEGCIAHAISLTSPRDACCSTAVSTAFRSAVASDTVWNSFLPSDLESILARADRPVDFSSKKELFFRLCDKPILLDGGKMIFSLDRSSGAKCFMLSARELAITWADTDSYWRWVPEPDSRFSEVAELLSVCWLEIRGHFKCKMLSSKTTYAAYLIFKLSDRAYGLGHPLQEASVELGTESSTSVVCLQSSDMYAHMHARRSRVWFRRGLHWRRRVLTVNESQEADDEAKEAAGRVPQLRNDGWMEIELGEFYNCGEEDKDVHVSLLEVKGGHWKIGLIIEGIEIRPKK
ncbi:F-box protein PP2-B10-like [Zingiber officinale]|uniref:F-box protein PP2-B10-like n=1 Tax=Zingiber officinale TaxID=94328 RepID=UPI001C4C1E6B|nr:F-box protein PP2-B10-like [Zingiber officinale]